MREKGTCTLRRNIKLCRLFAIVFHLRLQIMFSAGAFYTYYVNKTPRVNKKAGTVTKNEEMIHSSDSPFKLFQVVLMQGWSLGM